MHKADMDSLAGRIASMRFAVVLLAEVMEVQGLATHTEIRDMLGTAVTKPTRAATVAKALSAISQRVEAPATVLWSLFLPAVRLSG